MSQKPTREELAAQAEMARLQAELAAAKAEAARLRLEMAEREPTAADPGKPEPAKPEPAAAVNRLTTPAAAPAPPHATGNGQANGKTAPLEPAAKAPPPSPPPVASAATAKPPRSEPPRSEPPRKETPREEPPRSDPPRNELPRPSDADEHQPSRSLISRRLFQAMGAWTASMIVHAVCLIVLAITMLPSLLKPEPPQLEASIARPDEQITAILEENLTPATEVTMNTVSSSVLPVGHRSNLESASASQPVFDRAVSESIDAPKVSVGDVSVWSVKGRDLGVDVPEGAPGDPQAVVDNYDQAFDRITQEIMMMLVKNKVLVVWVFDQSESMKDDQQEIRDRIERVYAELGLVNAAKGDALLTAVASYGSKWQMHTRKPTYDLDVIREAISAVPVDESGKEMMCEAVGNTVTALHSVATSGRRQLAMILVTDESGDQKTNVELLEQAIVAAKSARCRIYILGREAVFGYPYAHMRWSHPRVGTLWLPIDRGPETPFAEQLQTEGFQRRYDAHSSGAGPYEQARMARETGGIFFMLPSLETDLVRGEKRRYELEAMRPYLPDLSARHEYAFERDSSPLRATLWKVISDLNPYDPVKAKVIDMRLRFSADIPTFARQVAEEQEKAKLYVTYLHEAEQALDKLKSHREKEPYPRWQANYDLIYAQVLAYKVRVYEYGAYLEDFKKNPKQVPLKKPPNLTLARWDISHRQKTITGELTADYIARSRELFDRVLSDHAGTPWAARATWELKRGFGIELTEVYHGPPNRNPKPPSGPPVRIPKL